ncbi:hypothetical protein C5S39_15300 [Candidatus Methanophagaceae archaeon]|nr:hypothetical protein C5S39_15300 [Methanophagales archaeon]
MSIDKLGIMQPYFFTYLGYVKSSGVDTDDTLWLESHIISIPVSHDYNLNDMEYIAESIQRWQKG